MGREPGMIPRMIARLLLATPWLGRAIRSLIGAPNLYDPALLEGMPLEQRIAYRARQLRDTGTSPVPALAAAEAIELCRENGWYYDSIEYDDLVPAWMMLATTDHPSGEPVYVPLERATAAALQELASRN